jgi:hypothetical protein
MAAKPQLANALIAHNQRHSHHRFDASRLQDRLVEGNNCPPAFEVRHRQRVLAAGDGEMELRIIHWSWPSKATVGQMFYQREAEQRGAVQLQLGALLIDQEDAPTSARSRRASSCSENWKISSRLAAELARLVMRRRASARWARWRDC